MVRIDFYFGDAVEIPSNDCETDDTESTTENEHDTNCTNTQPPFRKDPTDHDISFLVKLSQILQQTQLSASLSN